MDQLLNQLTEVGEILSGALERDPEEREVFLVEACKSDIWLRHVVEEAVRREDSHESVLEPGGIQKGLLWDDLSAWLVGEETISEGARIGPYRVVRIIGRGGMGLVLLAERADGQFEQRVALKILAGGLDRNDLNMRFAQERQILASLNHPTIARLLDSGMTDEGRPYFVMEFVEGLPIDQYCDERRLTIEERLKLFRIVVDAVQYAHRSLVVHRDLKPSNILITAEGSVKLLDFGIAKVLDSAVIPHSAPRTRTFLRIMTPEYASPEQVKGLPVTTASDVYQLGLLLYELLSGRRPYDLSERTPGEIERVVCEHQPTPPSMAVAEKRATGVAGRSWEVLPERFSEARRVSPGRLRKILRGDLDTIVLMALRKEPERRFASAEHLGGDIERYLSGQPVSACKDTLVYRLRKFFHRHSIAVCFVVALIVLVGYFTQRLAYERDLARFETEKATHVSSFLKDLLGVSDPGRLKGETISIQELLSWGARKSTEELSAQPEIRAMILTTLGDIYRKRGMYGEALPLLNDALALREDHLGRRHFEVATSLNALADLNFAQSRYSKAEALYQHALSIQEEALGREHPDVAATLDRLGALNATRAKFPEAAVFFKRALEIRERTLGPDHPDIAASLTNVALLNGEHGKSRLAEQQHRRALTITERTLGADHPQAATILNHLAFVCRNQGRFGEAETLFRKSLKIREERFGSKHPQVLASVNNLGEHCQRLGRFDEAEQLYRRALAIAESILRPDHADIAVVLNNLCGLCLDQGRYSEARPFCEQALAIRKNTLRVDHPLLASSFHNLARLYQSQGNYVDAEPLHLRALEISEEFDRVVARAARLNDVAHNWIKLGKYEDANKAFQRSFGILERAQMEGDYLGYHCTIIKASTYLGLGDTVESAEEAHTMWAQAVAIIEPLTQQTATVQALDIYASALLRLGRVEEAQLPLEQLSNLGWYNPDLPKYSWREETEFDQSSCRRSAPPPALRAVPSGTDSAP